LFISKLNGRKLVFNTSLKVCLYRTHRDRGRGFAAFAKKWSK